MKVKGKNEMSMDLLKKLGFSEPSIYQIQLMEELLAYEDKKQNQVHDSLTKKQVRCLELAALGNSAKEVADLLELKKATVETHYQIIRKKLNCRNMTQCVFKGIQLGYLPCAPAKKMTNG